MASINFTQFNLKTPLCATDYLVGIRADQTEEIKTTVSDVLNLYDLGQVKTLSTNWNVTYTNVSQNSAYWNSRSDVVNANAGNWNTAFNSVPVTNSSYTTLNANSANWNASYAGSVDFISAYTTTRNNSANWNIAFVASPKAFSVYTSVTANSGNWNSVYSSTVSNSANWNTAFSLVPRVNSNYTTTNANSANWNTAFSVVPRVNSSYTTVNANSANWNLAHKISTDYRNISASYVTKLYTDSKFLPLTGGMMTGDLSIYGSLSASGTATFFNTETVTISTIFVENYGTGPALTVHQYGTEPVARFYDEGQVVFAIEDSDKVIIGGLEASDQILTIIGGASATEDIYASNLYTETLCAVNVYGENINYEEWDSVYTTVSANSSSWDYQGTDIKDLTANWENTYLSLSTYLPLSGGTISQDLNVQGSYFSAGVSFFDIFTGRVDVNNVVIASSSKWDSTYTTLCANSGTWNKSVLSDVALESSTAGLSTVRNIVALTEEAFASLSEKNPSTLYVIVSSSSANFLPVSLFQDSTGNWESAYNTVYANSATTWNYQGTDIKNLSSNWESTYTSISTVSSNWDSTYTTVCAYSALWILDSTIDTGVRALTSNWNSAYTTVSTNSGSWNYQGTDIKSISAIWESTYTTVCANSASWVTDSTMDTEVRNLTSNWESSYTTLCSNSANWNYQGTDIKNISGNWESSYTTVNQNSADWLPFSIYDGLTADELTDYSETEIFILSALPLELPQAGTYEFKFSTKCSGLSVVQAALNDAAILGLSSSNNAFSMFCDIRSQFNISEQNSSIVYTNPELSVTYEDQLRNDIDPLNTNKFYKFDGFVTVSNPTTIYFYISAITKFVKPSVGKSFYMLNYKPNATINAF